MSFHGRDLFAPVAARLARAETVETAPLVGEAMVGNDWPREASQIVYIDGFGNLVTGLRSEKINKNSKIQIAGQAVDHAETFCRVPPGQLFWYPNSLGLIEIAANGESAATKLSLVLGDKLLLD